MTIPERLDAILAELGESLSPSDRAIVDRVVQNSITLGFQAAHGVDNMSDEWPFLAAQLRGLESVAVSTVRNAVSRLIGDVLGQALSAVRVGLGLPVVP